MINSKTFKVEANITLIVIWNLLFWKDIYERALSMLGYRQILPVIHIFMFVASAITYLYLILKKKNKLYRMPATILPVFIVIFFLIEYLIYPNDYLSSYISDFLKYVFLPMLIITSIDDYGSLIKVYCSFALVDIFLFGMYPLFYEGDFQRMSYGFNVILPSFLGLYLYKKEHKSKWILPVELLTLLLGLIYANRSVLLACAFFAIGYVLFVEENDNRRIIQISIYALILLFLYLKIDLFVDAINSLLIKLNYHSYSFSKIVAAIHGDYSAFLSGREIIYANAIEMIKESLMIGSGIGVFETFYGFYTHNIVLDFLLSFGLFGLIAIVSIFGFTFYSFWKEKKVNSKKVLLLFTTFWFPKLLFSSIFLTDIGFWCCCSLLLSISWKSSHFKKMV